MSITINPKIGLVLSIIIILFTGSILTEEEPDSSASTTKKIVFQLKRVVAFIFLVYGLYMFAKSWLSLSNSPDQ